MRPACNSALNLSEIKEKQAQEAGTKKMGRNYSTSSARKLAEAGRMNMARFGQIVPNRLRAAGSHLPT
jgi:hypothetical protein